MTSGSCRLALGVALLSAFPATVSLAQSPGNENLPPSVKLINPQRGETFRAPAEIRLMAAAHDADGEVRSAEFFANGTSVGVVRPDATCRDGSGSIYSFRMDWTAVPAGAYELTVVATDDAGERATSDSVNITVVDPQVSPIVSILATDAVASEPGILTVVDDAECTLYRRGNNENALTVWYEVGGTAINGVDYDLLSGQAVFEPGSETATVRIHALADDLEEATETVRITLMPSPLDVEPPPYSIGAPASACASIRDSLLLPVDLAPRVKITEPANGQVFTAPASIPITALTVDPDGYVPRMDFYRGDRLLGTVEMAFLVKPDPGLEQTFVFEWKDAEPGCHMLRARATDDSGKTGWSLPIGIVVVPDHLPPTVTVVATDPLAAEPSSDGVVDQAVFVLQRMGNLTDELKVKYQLGGTAENGVDYALLSGEVTIPAESRSARVVVDPLADDLVEGAESVVIRLEDQPWITIDPPPPGCYRVGALDRAVAKIRDANQPANQPPRVRIVKPLPKAVFQAPADVALVAAGLDSDGSIVRVEFYADGEKIGEQEAVDPAVGRPDTDQHLDCDRQVFAFTWKEAPAGEHVLTARALDDDGAVGVSQEVPIRVIEGALPPLVMVVATDPRAAERPDDLPANTATFRIRRTGPITAPLNVLFALSGTAENGVDYDLLPEEVTIPAGKRSVRVVVTPRNDNVPENWETVVLTLHPLASDSATAAYRAGWPHRACAVIVDDDSTDPNVRSLIGSDCEVALSGTAGMPYCVEVSGDLRTWLPVMNVLADETGRVRFVDPETEQYPNRFYRVLPVVVEAMEVDD